MAEGYRQVTTRDKVAFFAMIVGMFMAVLDIQIVASSLSVIGAGLSATPDELSWVQTAYIIAEVIIIPITGFLARVLSTRISYFIAALGFTVMSVMCSIAWDINSMIVFRALQGFFGGAMIPTVFATTFIIFPPSVRPKISIIIGLTVTVAPTLGPTIGGYITEVASWHFMFLVNVLPGIFVCAAVFLLADFDKPNYQLLKNFDYIGITLMATTLGALQYILEEGTPKGWFDSNLILSLTLFVVFGLIALVWRELTAHNPILDLRAFKNKNFSLGCIYAFSLGVGLYGAVYILPLFLFRIAGMDTFQIGIVMMVTGGFQFLAAPIAGKLYGAGIDRRIMLAIGLILFAFGCYLNSFLTPYSNFWELFAPQACRGFALMFCFIPINDIALGALDKSQVQNASGLYNLNRNLGGAIGLAVINLTLINETKIFSQYLNSNITITDPNVINSLGYITSIFDGRLWNPDLASIAILNNLVQRDAFIMAINNVFLYIALIFLGTILLLPFSDAGASRAEGAH
jgi:DHA2 family multidrug resistance protein